MWILFPKNIWAGCWHWDLGLLDFYHQVWLAGGSVWGQNCGGGVGKRSRKTEIYFFLLYKELLGTMTVN